MGSEFRLHIMNVDGSGVVLLPQPAGSNTFPSWVAASAAPAIRATPPGH